jgi:hypothetical protein
MIEQINEKFLLELLHKTTEVYHLKTREENQFYFYLRDLGPRGCQVVIPCNHSINFDINFIFEQKDNQEDVNVNYSVGSIYEFPSFFAELYQKYEKSLNNHPFYDENKDKIKDIIKTPFDKLNKNYFSNELESNKKKYQFLTETGELIIHLGKALFYYESAINFAPLEPIRVEHYYKNNKNENFQTFIKIIPAYKAEEFPIISHFMKPTQCFSNFKKFTEELNKASESPESKGLISSLVLELELNKNDTKIKKHKI